MQEWAEMSSSRELTFLQIVTEEKKKLNLLQ